MTKIFLDTSVLEQVLNKTSLHEPTMKLLRNCKKEKKLYHAYFSFLSILELIQKGYSLKQLEELETILNKHSIILAYFTNPREVDLLTRNLKHSKKHNFENEFHYYLLAFFGYCDIGYFVTWNYELLNNAKRKELYFHSLLNAGYGAWNNKDYNSFESPQFFLPIGEKRQNINLDDLAYLSSETLSVNPSSGYSQSDYKYEALQNNTSRSNFFTKYPHQIFIPSSRPSVSNTRIPKILTQETVWDIKFSIYDYISELGKENIPLVRLPQTKDPYNHREFRIFKINFTKGKEVIKNLIEDTIFYRPQEEETEWSEEEYKENKITTLFKVLIPVIKTEIEKGYREEMRKKIEAHESQKHHHHRHHKPRIWEIENFTIENKDFERIGTSQLDQKIAATLHLDSEQLYDIKLESIKLMMLVLGEKWKPINHWSFYTKTRWNVAIPFHADTNNHTFFNLDKNGKELSIIIVTYISTD